MPSAPIKILVVRNDKLGDFCLALPAFAMLKQCFPVIELHALVPAYTRPIAELCPFIDQIVVDPGESANSEDKRQLKQQILNEKYSAAVTLFSTTRIGWLLWQCAIPVRIAPATKLAQLFYNHRITQRRSRSLKPEYQYNLDLISALASVYGQSCEFKPEQAYINVDPSDISALKSEFSAKNNIGDKQLVFVHPGSGGSANNLSLEQYAELIQKLDKHPGLFFVISAGPGEFAQAHKVKTIVQQQQDIDCMVYESTQGLYQFVQHIALADLFISGSTGPLHIAGALNRPTTGFYTNRQSATSLRWQTLSADDRRLVFSPPPDAEAEDMSKVDLDTAAEKIMKLLVRLYS